VHFLGHRTDIAALMAAVDVVVHSSTASEPFGRVIVEGMLAGRPVLATDHGASREVRGEETLCLVPPGDPGQLAAALRRILALPATDRAALGHQARARALFSRRAMLAGIDRVVALDSPL
jgi:glycosyltransferase involved in cell wall biosynthesis